MNCRHFWITISILILLCVLWRISARPERVVLDWEDKDVERDRMIRTGNHVSTYTHFRPMMDAMTADICQAKNYILVQFFKFEDDSAGNELADLLILKSSQGIPVYVLYDQVSNRKNSRLFRKMSRAGVHVDGYGKLHFPFLWRRDNYRNHRKVVVVDGRVGYLGGMNIASRYEQGLDWGTWRDTHLRIEGASAIDLANGFVSDWRYTTSMSIELPQVDMPESVGPDEVEILHAGPIGCGPTIMERMIALINQSQQSVYLESPYFIPTPEVFDALKRAAARGVEVRVLIPPRGDKGVLTPLATRSYIQEALEAGIKIGYYNGYIHSKIGIFDTNVATVGSTNIDPRSFLLDQEVNAFIYNASYVHELKSIFVVDSINSQFLSLKHWQQRPRRQQRLERFARKFSSQL